MTKQLYTLKVKFPANPGEGEYYHGGYSLSQINEALKYYLQYGLIDSIEIAIDETVTDY